MIFVKNFLLAMRYLAVFLMALFLLAGCDVKNKPVSLQGSPLVGVWEAQITTDKKEAVQSTLRMYLEFTAQGYIAFHRVDCWKELTKAGKVWHEKTFKIDFMPVIKLRQDKVKAQWMRFTPTLEFQINQWPAEQAGVMQLTVDNVVLTKQVSASDRSDWRCPKQASEN